MENNIFVFTLDITVLNIKTLKCPVAKSTLSSIKITCLSPLYYRRIFLCPRIDDFFFPGDVPLILHNMRRNRAIGPQT